MVTHRAVHGGLSLARVVGCGTRPCSRYHQSLWKTRQCMKYPRPRRSQDSLAHLCEALEPSAMAPHYDLRSQDAETILSLRRTSNIIPSSRVL